MQTGLRPVVFVCFLSAPTHCEIQLNVKQRITLHFGEFAKKARKTGRSERRKIWACNRLSGRGEEKAGERGDEGGGRGGRGEGKEIF